MTFNNHADVGEFHQKFGLHSVNYSGPGSVPFNDELMQFRVKFMIEELLEFCEGAGYTLKIHDQENIELSQLEGVEPDHAQMFDALIDLVYVALGTAHLNGYPWSEGWDLVQRANMAKVRAAPDGSNSKRGSSFDVVKPKGWEAPDIEGVLLHYGWDEPTFD